MQLRRGLAGCHSSWCIGAACCALLLLLLTLLPQAL
jgi:hypothetical protein